MLAAFASALKTPDLRKKILFTLAMVAVYRLGATLPSPGVSYKAINACLDFNSAQGGGGGQGASKECPSRRLRRLESKAAVGATPALR